MSSEKLKHLPEFIGTAHLARILNRDVRTVMSWCVKGKLPPRTKLTDRTKGWKRDIIVPLLKKHPEMFG